MVPAKWFISGGVIGGILNGLLGTGGGIVLLYTFKLHSCLERRKQKKMGLQASHEGAFGGLKDSMAATIMAILPMSAVSAIVYYFSGLVDVRELYVYLPGAFVGGIIGALLLERLKVVYIKKLFAVMIIYAGVRMVWGS